MQDFARLALERVTAEMVVLLLNLAKALKDPINQMVSTEYVVTGSWSDPVIANKKREPLNDGKAGRR